MGSSCSCVTWLESNLTEHHPSVAEGKLTPNGIGHAIPQRNCDKSSTWACNVQNGLERNRPGLPIWLRVKVTDDFLEYSHPWCVHVVAVNLRGWARTIGTEAKGLPLRYQTFVVFNKNYFHRIRFWWLNVQNWSKGPHSPSMVYVFWHTTSTHLLIWVTYRN